MEFKGFFNEEICIVRYKDNACKYVRVESTDQLGAEIDEFTKGSDYELQYMEGDLTGQSTQEPFMVYLIAEEEDKDIRLVNALYDYYGNSTDVQNVLKYDDYFLEYGKDEGDAFESYCDNLGVLDEVPERLRYYFDYERYKRDCELEGLNIIATGIYSDNEELYLLTNY